MATGNAINANSTGLVRYNGTGTFDAVTTTNHDILIGASSNGITNVAPSATSGIPLISQGASADPAFGTAVVAGGGTGATTLTGVLVGNGTSAFTTLTLVTATSWTPNVQINGSSTGITYTTQLGSYYQIGNIVFINMSITLSNKGSSTGNVTISNLPVSTGTNGANQAIPMGFGGQVSNAGAGTVGLLLNTSSAVGNFTISSWSGGGSGFLTNAMITNTFQVIASGIYFTN